MFLPWSNRSSPTRYSSWRASRADAHMSVHFLDIGRDERCDDRQTASSPSEDPMIRLDPVDSRPLLPAQAERTLPFQS